MNFKQRLLRYMIGVSIGLLISIALFKDKLYLFTSWTPGNVVKSRIYDSYWNVSPQSDCLLNCIQMDVKEFKNYVKTGDVDFSRSQTKGPEKEYQLVFPDSELLSSARFAVKDSSATMLELVPKSACDCP